MVDEVITAPSVTVTNTTPDLPDAGDEREIANLLVEKFDSEEGAEHNRVVGPERDTRPESDVVTTPTEPSVEVQESPEDTPEELKAGYLRHRDYTRKTQELAHEKRQLEESQAALKRQYEDSIQLAMQYMQGGQDPVLIEAQKIDWVKMAQEDPAGFVAKRALVEQKVAQMQSLYQQGNETRQKQLGEILARESEQLYSKLPEWKDEKVRAGEVAELTNYLQRNGFKKEEVDSTIDHRALLIARKSMLYDKLMEAKKGLPEKRATPKPTSTMRPRGGDSLNGTKDKSAIERAKQTGKNDDIVKAILSNI